MQRQLPLYILKHDPLVTAENIPLHLIIQGIITVVVFSFILNKKKKTHTHSQTPTLNPLYTNYLLAKYLKFLKLGPMLAQALF